MSAPAFTGLASPAVIESCTACDATGRVQLGTQPERDCLVCRGLGERAVVYLSTVQLHAGGDSHDDKVHLVRGILGSGTPGSLLCGFDHHASDLGFSVGGGISGPGVRHEPCAGCVEAARQEFPAIPIAGMPSQSEPIADALGVDWFGHMGDVPAVRESRS